MNKRNNDFEKIVPNYILGSYINFMRDGPRTVRSGGINTANKYFTGLRPVHGKGILLNYFYFTRAGTTHISY